MVLGSGFHHVLKELEVDAEISYEKLPGLSAGRCEQATRVSCYIGRLGGTPVMVLSGRAHFYEGHPMTLVPSRCGRWPPTASADLLLTNAAGGVNRAFEPVISCC